jgi:Mrp family chromosome partitioning ATPase
MKAAIAKVSRSEATDAFEQVLGRLQAMPQALDRARVLGVVGCRSGDGATFVLDSIARMLAARSRKRILKVDSEDLIACTNLGPSELIAQCRFAELFGVWTLSPSRGGVTSQFRETGVSGDLRDTMAALDARFDFVLLDCGAVTSSGRLWQVAPFMDDLLLVVAAGETKRTQVAYAQRIIEQSGATLSGCVLNKRTYPLPDLIHRIMS